MALCQRASALTMPSSIFLPPTHMPKHYHSFSNRAGATLKWGLWAVLVLAIIAYWPSEIRKVQHQVTAMAVAVSHHGSTLSPGWLNGLSSNIHENCASGTTALNIDGVFNEALTQPQLVEAVTQVASSSTDFSLKLEHVTVNLPRGSNRAQVNADAVLDVTHGGRVDHEMRQVRMILEKTGGKFRLVSVEASAPIVNQPEPRP